MLDEAETLLGMTSDQVLTSGLVIETTMSRTHQDQLDKEFTKNVFPADASDGTPVQGAAAWRQYPDGRGAGHRGRTQL